MDKIFTVKWQDKVELCKGYSHACQVATKLVDDGINPEIVIQCQQDDWNEKLVDSNASNFIE